MRKRKKRGTYRGNHDTVREKKGGGAELGSQSSSKNRNKGTYTGLCHRCNGIRMGKLHRGKKRGKYHKPKLKKVQPYET